MKLILASASPRRKEIMNNVYLYPEIKATKFNENKSLSPKKLVKVNAIGKCNEIKIAKGEIVIAADTIVCLNNKVFGKPKERIDAVNMLKALSNKTHKVITGVCIKSVDKQVYFSETTKVIFDNLSIEQIENYIDRENVYDKAGSYGIQDSACAFIKGIKGDYFNVMGLPINHLLNVLKEFE